MNLYSITCYVVGPKDYPNSTGTNYKQGYCNTHTNIETQTQTQKQTQTQTQTRKQT